MSSDTFTPKKQDDTGSNWKDPKRYLWLLSPALPVIGLAALSAYAIAPKRLSALIVQQLGQTPRDGNRLCFYQSRSQSH
jgi:hypothetical protein